MLGAANPVRGLDGAGDGDQAAGFFRDPFFDEFDLGRIELGPIGVERDDAIVLVELFGRAREMVEDVVRVLRNAGLGGLQKHVDDHRGVAMELIAKELVVAHRSAGEKQDARFAIDDFNFGFAFVIAGVAVVGRGFDAQLEDKRARLAWLEVERDWNHFAVGPKRHALRGDRRAGAALVLRAAAGELDIDGLACVAVGLKVTGDVERIVWEGARGHDDIADCDVALGGGGTDADCVERHACVAGCFDRGARFDAGILGAVGHYDYTGERRVVVQAQFIGQRLAQPRFGATWLQGGWPINSFFFFFPGGIWGRLGCFGFGRFINLR